MTDTADIGRQSNTQLPLETHTGDCTLGHVLNLCMCLLPHLAPICKAFQGENEIPERRGLTP